jgi:hypothetical protein
VKSKTMDLLITVWRDDLQHCFEQRKIRTQRCIDRAVSTLKALEINL